MSSSPARKSRVSHAAVATGQRPLSALVAACLVVLQLATALHFALVPHGFSAGLSGFVHLHPALAAERARHAGPGGARSATPSGAASVAVTEVSAAEPRVTLAFVVGSASCEPDSCPIGFAGPTTLLFAASPPTALLAFTVSARPAVRQRAVTRRRLVLLSAPKTSPPLA